MTHMKAINASMYSDLSFLKDNTVALTGTYTGVTTATAQGLIDAIMDDRVTDTQVATACAEFFQTKANYQANCIRIKDIREFPAMGTPPNIVNVPVYGQKTSQQIQGQADAPSLEIQINYVADEWQDAAGKLGSIVGNGEVYIFRFTMMSSDPLTYDGDAIKAEPNTEFYFLAKLEAMQVTPQLTDANTCTLTLSLQSDFYGPATLS